MVVCEVVAVLVSVLVAEVVSEVVRELVAVVVTDVVADVVGVVYSQPANVPSTKDSTAAFRYRVVAAHAPLVTSRIAFPSVHRTTPSASPREYSVKIVLREPAAREQLVCSMSKLTDPPSSASPHASIGVDPRSQTSSNRLAMMVCSRQLVIVVLIARYCSLWYARHVNAETMSFGSGVVVPVEVMVVVTVLVAVVLAVVVAVAVAEVVAVVVCEVVGVEMWQSTNDPSP